jgi:hypothetical protein
MPESGEQSSVVFALIVMEPASECVCVERGGRLPQPFPLPQACSVIIYAKTTVHCSPDSSMVKSMGWKPPPLTLPDLSTASIFICMGCK